MAPRPAKETRENFEAGKIDEWSAGEYGAVVRVKAEKGRIKVFWKSTKTGERKQRRLFSTDSRELRQLATKTAVEMSEGIRAGVIEEAADEKVLTADTLTLFDACVLYMRGRAAGFTDEMMEWGAGKLSVWYAELPEAVRETVPSVETLVKDLSSFRAVFQHANFARERLVSKLEPSDWRIAQQEWLRTFSPRTVANWRDRLSLVFRYIRTEHRKSIGLIDNPLDGAKAVRTKARIPEYTIEERGKLLAKATESLDRGNYWRVWAVLAFSHSGRRIESVLNLTAVDHDFEKNEVTWRAEFAKAENYGRGSDVRPMTQLHREAVKWAIENHPNPLGAEHPVLWSPGDPRKPISYPSVHLQWQQLETDAKVEHIKGRAFHSMRRAIVTLISATLGVEDAADFVGMTPATANTFNYRQTLKKSMERVSDAIDSTIEDSQK